MAVRSKRAAAAMEQAGVLTDRDGRERWQNLIRPEGIYLMSADTGNWPWQNGLSQHQLQCHQVVFIVSH